ncbi:MAG: RidA family protein [Thermodesulfobacteriota bacterium]
MKEAVETTGAPAAIGPYSQGVMAGEFLFISGQIPLDPESGAVVGVTIEEQTGRVMESLEAILNASGMRMEHVVKTTIYLTDLNDFAQVNSVYSKFLHTPFPARATVGVKSLPKGVKVEIDAIAVSKG